MKRFLSVMLIFLVVLGTAAAVFAHPNNLSEYIFVVRNDEAVIFGDEKPFTIDGYTYVPDYTIHDWLEADIAWNDSEKSLTMSYNGLQAKAYEQKNLLELPSKSMNINFYRSNGVLMLPLEPIAEGFYLGVSYNPEGRILRFTNGGDTLTDEEIYNKFIAKIDEEKANLKPSIPEGTKVVYLTFDDGPDRTNTPKILDILKKYNAKATFFMLESNMRNNPDIVKRMKEEGHTVGLHGVTHAKNRFYGTAWSPTIEMEQANATLMNITGEGTCFVRVPYGSAPNLTNTQYQNLKGTGFLMWDWNIDSEDSLRANVPTQTIYNNSIAGLAGKDKPVMLFHDRTNIVNCLDSLLSYLVNNGYTPVAITESVTPYNWKER